MLLLVISCGRQKLNTPAPAAQMYTGGYFKTLLGYALSVADPERIRILSAKHGLIPLDFHMEPYNIRMGEVGSISLAMLKTQLVPANRVIALVGKPYADLLTQAYRIIETPLCKFRMAYQMQILKRNMGRLPPFIITDEIEG